MQARSRLKSSVNPVTPVFSATSVPKSPLAHNPKRTLPQPEISFNPMYLQRLPTLIFGLVWYGAVWFIINSVNPEQIQNWPVANLYAPFQLTLFLGNWLILSYVFLNSRRGYVVATFLQTLVLLKLQEVMITWQITLGLLLFFAIIEAAGTWLEHRALPDINHANVQKTFHRRRRPPTRTVLQRFS